MLLPTSATAALVALIVCLVAWGSWAAFYKAAKKARFEYFAYDFAWGALLMAVLAAFTLGMWDSKELTFQDNFLLTGYRKMAWALGSGVAFTVANALLLGSIAVSRMAIAFPMAFGVAWMTGSVTTYFVRPGVNSMLAFGGAVTALTAAILAAVGFRLFLADQTQKAVKALNADPRTSVAAPRPTAGKAFVLAALAGVFYSTFFYALEEAMRDDNGLASYSAALLLGAGIFGASIVVVPFFLNFPVRGKPLTVRQYVQVERIHHLLGLAAGAVWMAGTLAWLVTIGLPSGTQADPIVGFMIARAFPLVAILLGFLIFRELPEAPTKVNAMVGASFVLLLAGIGMIAVAPLYGR